MAGGVAVEHAAATRHQQLGQLAPLVEDSNLLALLLGKLSLAERCSVALVCRRLCQKVRATMAVRLVLDDDEGKAAAAMAPWRTFAGAVHITYNGGPCRSHHRAMAALLRYAADTWPYVTSVALWCDPECPALISNPVALVGPLNSLALMPHLVQLSLYAPRLEGLEAEALAALTGVTQLKLSGTYTPQRGSGESSGGVGAVGMPPRGVLTMPAQASLSRLVHLAALQLEYVAPGSARLPPSLTAVTIMPAAMVGGWLPALAACQHLQQLEVMYDKRVRSTAPSTWQLLVQLVPRLQHLTFLALGTVGKGKGIRPELLLPRHDGPLLAPCFPHLRNLVYAEGVDLQLTEASNWQLLAACSALTQVYWLAAAVPPPPDFGLLGLKDLGVVLKPAMAEGAALLRHCPHVTRLDVEVTAAAAHNSVMPQALPLVLAPLKHLQHVVMRFDAADPQLVEVLAPSLSTTCRLDLAMPLCEAGILPDLSLFCQLTRLVWTVPDNTATGPAGEQEYPLPDDLLWCLRGCGGLVEITLTGWTWLDARLALAAAGAHSALRRLRLEGCGVLPASSMSGPQQRLQNIRCLLRPSLVLEVV